MNKLASEVHFLDIQPRRSTDSHARSGEDGEQHTILALCCLDDSLQLLLGKSTAVSIWGIPRLSSSHDIQTFSTEHKLEHTDGIQNRLSRELLRLDDGPVRLFHLERLSPKISDQCR
jgi:hypothetical protein